MEIHGKQTSLTSQTCLNNIKLIVKRKEMKFFRNIYSAEGVKADPDKVAAITAMRPPEIKIEVKSFLGMIYYLQQFLPKVSGTSKLIEERCVFYMGC